MSESSSPPTLRIAFWEPQRPWDAQAGGIASYVRHRACVLGERGFEVWWRNGRESARWDAGRRSWLPRPVPSAEPDPDLIELPGGWAKAFPALPPNTRIVLQCHTAALTRAWLNRDRFPWYSRAGLRQWSGWDRRRIARNLRRADAVLACSYEIAVLEAGFYGVHLDRFTVIPHAFSPHAEPGTAAGRAGDEHGTGFLVAGNLEYFKGFDLIAAGFLRYRERGGQGRLKIAGTTGWDDPNPPVQNLLGSEAARALFAQQGRGCVEFLGRLDKADLAGERARSTALLVGSRFEAFTMVAGEAFLSGCPVILSDRTGWRYPAALHQGARLFDPYDPGDLAAAMLEMENPEHRAHYRQGADRMAAFLTSDALAEKTAAFYRRAAGY